MVDRTFYPGRVLTSDVVSFFVILFSQHSPKTKRALAWSIPIVNHTWVEDCFVEWR